MNSISTGWNRSAYPAYPQRYVDLLIDGVFLDQFLDALLPGNDIGGLVVPCSGWLGNADERRVFWERIHPGPGCSAIAPVLICPDDGDFSCQTVVTLVEAGADRVWWRRFGLDDSSGQPSNPGVSVQWWQTERALEFAAAEYERVLAELRDAEP